MDDLISRQAALNCFHDWIDRHGDVHTADEMQEYNAIEALPSAQPEQPKRGTWIKNEDRRGWCCSECAIDDYYAYFLNIDTGVYELQDKFCYNCGADMRGEQDE